MPRANGIMNDLLEASRRLRDEAGAVRASLGPAAVHVYNPLEYAWDLHAAYVTRFANQAPREAVLVGMNPGPWGMVQTGIPFGDPVVVREWMGLSGAVSAPPTAEMHASRPVLGLASTRREISGSRLYGLANDAFGGIDAFFRRFWVVNYCPLAIFDASGRNITPVQLSSTDRALLAEPSDRHLRAIIALLRPRVVVGVGTYAEGRAREALAAMPPEDRPPVGRILHPSPASPRANTGWPAQALAELAELGIVP